ncbi:MAG: hypothetical protein HZRFUVUK_001369 [Candidatus Fervidibacterota bacterium]|jgi:phosphate transport system ATP-binding protein
MAEAFFREKCGDMFDVASAGLSPSSQLDQNAVQVMKEIGIDISKQRPKGLSDVNITGSDIVVTVGLDMDTDSLPNIPYRVEWDIPDPTGSSIEVYRRTRDLIEARVVELLSQLSKEAKAKFRIRNLWLYYGERPVLKNINLDIPERCIFALIGPSGCGKSSFLRCLNRMNDFIPNAVVRGEVFLDDVNIYDKAVDVVELRRRVGMVFQKPNPFPMSIFENVAYGPRIHGTKEKRRLTEIVERALKEAALWEEVKDMLHQSAFTLSGGQQQRLCIARALAVEPEVLLLDEPCSALDPASTLRIEELMLELKKKLTIVLVTHNMFQASRVADLTGFILDGELIEVGPTSQVFENPKDERTDSFIRGRFG